MKHVFCTVLAIVLALASFATNAVENAPNPKTSSIDQFIQSQAEAIGGKEALARQISDPFDFDGLRETDIAVLYWISKDNDTTAYLAVFEKGDKSWTLTHHLRLGGRGLRHITNVTFSERRIRFNALEFAGDEPLSSPSLRVSIDLWTEYGLLNISRKEHKEE